MPKKSYIYIIDWTERHNCIKIGKANNIWERYRSLKRDFGEADLENSYWLEEKESNIYNIEKIIHTFIRQYKIDYPVAVNGYTELFQYEALEEIKLICNKMGIVLHHGINNVSSKIYKEHSKKKGNGQEFSRNIVEKNRSNLSKIIEFFRRINTYPDIYFIENKRILPEFQEFCHGEAVIVNQDNQCEFTFKRWQTINWITLTERQKIDSLQLVTNVRWTYFLGNEILRLNISEIDINNLEKIINEEGWIGEQIKQYYADLLTNLVEELNRFLKIKQEILGMERS